MKITWFAATTFRIQISGRIIVLDPAGAPDGVDAGELVAGADHVIRAEHADIDTFDPAKWAPRRRARLIDEGVGADDLRLYRSGAQGLVCDSRDEGLLVLDGGDAQWGRWADGSRAVLCGTGARCAARARALLDAARPRLMALAVSDGDTDATFDTVAPLLGGASLMVLERGLALET